jgi:hypothetical protein
MRLSQGYHERSGLATWEKVSSGPVGKTKEKRKRRPESINRMASLPLRQGIKMKNKEVDERGLSG